MNISAPFIKRPIATSQLTIALLLSGFVAFPHIPVASLPEVAYPTIMVSAQLPGASPDTMASAVAAPLERMFGRISGITQMTSSSSLGTTYIVLQFDLSRNADAAGRDVQAAINAARGHLPSNLPTNPNWRKVNPAESPVMVLTLTSQTAPSPEMYDVADSILAQKIQQIPGIGVVTLGGSSKPAQPAANDAAVGARFRGLRYANANSRHSGPCLVNCVVIGRLSWLMRSAVSHPMISGGVEESEKIPGSIA
jgi:multidrug efflux pump